MSEFTIKQIFQDNWDNFVLENNDIKIRPIVFEEVNKIINCGNPDFGYALYICEHCGKFLKVPFRCKSRFCNTCGVKYAQDRALSMAKNPFVASIDILYLQCLINYGLIFENIDFF